MTQNEIIEMAKQAWISDKEAKLITEFDMAYISCTYLTDLVAFAKLVAAKEREACAQLCIDEVWASTVNGTAIEAFNYASKECASRIRARGEA